MLNLRIIQQTQKRLFGRLMPLSLGDFALDLSSIIHPRIMRVVPSTERLKACSERGARSNSVASTLVAAARRANAKRWRRYRRFS